MRYPPLKILEAVQQQHIDYRVRRQVTHFRHFFRVLDSEGLPTDDPDKVAHVDLTQRAQAYLASQRAVPISA
jgi:hypothetical protein